MWAPLWVSIIMATLTRHCAKSGKVPNFPECADKSGGQQVMCNAAMARVKAMLAAEKEAALHPSTAPNVPIAKANRGLTLCTSMKCLCSELTGNASSECVYKGQKVGRVVRKEIRMMTKDERQRYFSAVLEMKKSGAFDKLYDIHTSAVHAKPSNAHHGPAFIPWHRELLKRFELELRRVDPGVALPYWDNRIEDRLGEKAIYSALFSSHLLGSSPRLSEGKIEDGPLAQLLYPYSQTDFVQRAIGAGSITVDVPDEYYERTLNFNATMFLGYYGSRAKEFINCPLEFKQTPYVEDYHNNGHVFIGGNMDDLTKASADPVFYMHHAFIDYWFEEFRQKQQTREQRETEYPTLQQCFLPSDQPTALMTLMEERRVIDGLSNQYTDIFYQYDPAPTCSAAKPDCGSEFLFCNNDTYRCVGKITLGQDCSGFESYDSCYNGRCISGICQEVPTTSTVTTMKTTTTTTTTTTTSARTSTTTTTTQTTTTPTTTTTMTSARTVTTPSTTSTTTTSKGTTKPFDPWIITDCKNCDIIPDEGCSDSYCARLKILGRCETKSDYMIYNCPLYCLTCESYFQAKNQGL